MLEIIHRALGLQKQCCTFQFSIYSSASGWIMFTHLDIWTKWNKISLSLLPHKPGRIILSNLKCCRAYFSQNSSESSDVNYVTQKKLKNRMTAKKFHHYEAETRQKCHGEWKKGFFFLNHNILSPFSCLIYFSSKTNMFFFICDGLNYFVVS